MKRIDLFYELAERNGLDVSEILKLEEAFIEKIGKKPSRNELSELCFRQAEVNESVEDDMTDESARLSSLLRLFACTDMIRKNEKMSNLVASFINDAEKLEAKVCESNE